MVKIKGWYFSGTSKKLRHGDNRRIAIGRTHKHKGDIKMCASGLHFSEDIFDALNYAPGPVVWRVEGSGEIEQGEDKVVCTERTYLEGGVDITSTLWEFARKCALDVVRLWDAPKVVVDYLKTGDESLRVAARDAARAAAWAAASAAARDAARAAASVAARAAAWDAAWAAASAATRAAASAAARDAARDATWDAARVAAWDAARDAARAKYSKLLLKMVTRVIKNG